MCWSVSCALPCSRGVYQTRAGSIIQSSLCGERSADIPAGCRSDREVRLGTAHLHPNTISPTTNSLAMLSALRTAPRIQASATASRLQRLAASPRRHYASVLDSLPKPGDRIHGFTLQKTKHVPELELSALMFQHDKTGADYLHVARDDENNVFSIGFKTNPPDATGVPHILEHVTLCSSEK